MVIREAEVDESGVAHVSLIPSRARGAMDGADALSIGRVVAVFV